MISAQTKYHNLNNGYNFFKTLNGKKMKIAFYKTPPIHIYAHSFLSKKSLWLTLLLWALLGMSIHLHVD